MNILQLNTHGSAGGAARAMHRLHKELRRHGHESNILVKATHSAEPFVSTVAQAVGMRETGVARLLSIGRTLLDREFGTPWIHASTRRLLRSPHVEGADVVHMHNLHGCYFDYTLLPQFSRRKPIVWTLHDMWAFTGHCAYAYDCTRWKSGCFQCPLLRGAGRQVVEPRPTHLDRTRTVWRRKRDLYRQTDLHVVTPSIWLRNLVADSILSTGASIQCIPNGVNMAVYRPMEQALAKRALDIPTDAKVILFVSAKFTEKRKGLGLLLEALRNIPQHDPILLLTIGGSDVPHQDLGQFQVRQLRQIYDSGLQRLVYNAADLFAFPTLADNQPLVILEAMACGTPVVSFNVGGVPEMVRHLQTGYLAHYQDIRDFTNGMVTLLEDAELRSRMGRASRRIAEDEYTLSLQASRYAAVYEQALQKHWSGRRRHSRNTG